MNIKFNKLILICIVYQLFINPSMFYSVFQLSFFYQSYFFDSTIVKKNCLSFHISSAGIYEQTNNLLPTRKFNVALEKSIFM
jgi:hypothetical protein